MKTVWLSGLPCSGKTTIAKGVEAALKKKGVTIVHLDGDDVRRGLNGDLGFSDEDREENLRRIGHVAQLFNNKEIAVVASFIAPLKKNRELLRSVVKEFNLVFVKCDVEECSRRDVKGMYELARKGELKGFTGVSAPFEEPENADLILETKNSTSEECVVRILEKYF